MSAVDQAVADNSVTVTGRDVDSAVYRSPLAAFDMDIQVDAEYVALPEGVWTGTVLPDVHRSMVSSTRATYTAEVSDCDDFAFWFRGFVPMRYQVNGVALVFDFNGQHAYNAVLVLPEGGDPGADLRVVFVEPQTDQEVPAPSLGHPPYSLSGEGMVIW